MVHKTYFFPMYNENCGSQQRRDLEGSLEEKHPPRVQTHISRHCTAQIQSCTALHQPENHIKNCDSAM